MKKKIKKILPKGVVSAISTTRELKTINKLYSFDKRRFLKYSFGDSKNIDSYQQLEARITKAYHSIEKGLSYQNIKFGFGKINIEHLINLMEIYKSKGYAQNSHCYSTALSNINEYIILHEKHNYDVSKLKEKYELLNENQNNEGGIYHLTKSDILKDTKENFEDFSLSRHSIRDYADEPVNISIVKKAIKLAQNTPSACNRQAWKVRVVSDEKLKKKIRENQNGNRGFGEKIDKFLVITTNNQYFSKSRERNQASIDGGMYSMNLLYSLHYYEIATIPLSASLTIDQEKNLRDALNIEDYENFIMFIGIGNYVDSFKVPKSTRREPSIIEL